ncbi:FMN-dependent NADH-azoreductase [Marinococcus halophilus]|uniref:FMN dependent NADH:quinone oxidoreductase n=1 Tax=Marinococcus halophilus TaxID=1371 RepID=A0A510Y4J7_MARHA|nr:FMN-dependent NADH-azoreductase [Marinococcus halophilus]OZT80211.1 FMN-dependent NADH-azoreductase [Marinococcus halophilus]GEK58266.1 FMN-dependent NADH-azoreductase 3 [Marinococcus halophilus]
MNVLLVKANNRPDGISTKMYETFLENVQDAGALNVQTYDVFEEDTPYFGQDFFDALGRLATDGEPTEMDRRVLAAKQKAKDAFSAADLVVFAFPLWNLTIPAKLQTFIDYIAEAGYTFKYSPEGALVPLMPEKKVIFLNARGGVYSAPEMAGMDMALTYMQNIFGGLYGMDIVDEVVIEGHNANPDQAEEIIEAGLKEVAEAASRVAYQKV